MAGYLKKFAGSAYPEVLPGPSERDILDDIRDLRFSEPDLTLEECLAQLRAEQQPDPSSSVHAASDQARDDALLRMDK